MANTKRRSEYIDRNGNMFIPMNVEGGVWNEHFITTPKLICIAGMILSLFVIVATLNSDNASFARYCIWLGIWGIISITLLRFVIFEEKFYYRMYKELQQHEISSPALFWNIASIKDTDEGAIITYSDARIGIMVKLERDTITGKNKDFKETHYDAISDFYKEVATNRYSFVQMNIMEQAGKDPRLNELSKIVTKSDNDNICKLMEMQVGHIKNITHAALYESDYFLFYTTDVSKIDIIVQDVSECVFKILDGAYVGYQILTSKEIVDLVKEIYGVNYFNATEASLLMFDQTASSMIVPFTVSGILWSDQYQQELKSTEINKLRDMTSSVIRETKKPKDLALKQTLYRRDDKSKIGIDFSELSKVPETKKPEQRTAMRIPLRKGNEQPRQTQQQRQGNGQNQNQGKAQVQSQGQGNRQPRQPVQNNNFTQNNQNMQHTQEEYYNNVNNQAYNQQSTGEDTDGDNDYIDF